MIGDTRLVSLKVVGEGGNATSRQAESLGLIVTELVMNALKHAFPDDKIACRLSVAYEVHGTNWKLSVAHIGVGKPDGIFAQPKTGLGTGIVKALAQQLDATVATIAGPAGTTVAPKAQPSPRRPAQHDMPVHQKSVRAPIAYDDLIALTIGGKEYPRIE
jgi:two-component sensor histidine kinase